MKNMEQMDALLRLLRGKKLLVIGGLGFLGQWVVNCAKTLGAEVTVVDKSEHDADAVGVRILHEDILSTPHLESWVEEHDYVVHLAGSLGTDCTFTELRSTAENNVVASTRVLEACLQVGRRAVYPMVANDWQNPYTITKRCAADLAIMANAECGGDFRVLRTMNAYGPWQAFGHTRKLIPVLFRQCLLNEPVDIYGDGNQCVDLIHAEDVAVAFLLACVVDDLPKDAYLDVGTHIPYRVIEVAEMVRKMVGSDSTFRFAGKRRGEPMHSVTVARDDSLNKLAGFICRLPLDVGLRDTYQWYLEHPSYLKMDPATANTAF